VDYKYTRQPYARPELASFAEDWDRTAIEVVKPLDERLLAVTTAIGKTHVNGWAAAAQFHIKAFGAVATALGSNRLKHVDFFLHFFANQVVQEALPQVANARSSVAEFEKTEITRAIEDLAAIISQGGAYRGFRGSASDANRLAQGFADAALQRRMSETFCWVNYSPWTEWFFDVAWDSTFFWYSGQTSTVTLLLRTDTD
jgi:hypothetical protein